MILNNIFTIILTICLNFASLWLRAQHENSIFIDHNYFKKNQVKNITFYIPVNEYWIKTHPTFNQQMNIKKYQLKYDSFGNCFQASWTLCSWDSLNNKIDTSIQSIENYLYFKYSENKLTRIDAISFSEINFIDFKYNEQSVIRHISYFENSQLKTKDDTQAVKPKIKEIFNPYEWAIFPTYQIIYIDDFYIEHFTINGIPILYFDEQLHSKNVILEVFPGFYCECRPILLQD